MGTVGTRCGRLVVPLGPLPGSGAANLVEELVNAWLSTKKELPSVNTVVEVRTANGSIETAFRYDVDDSWVVVPQKGNITIRLLNVTRWRPRTS